jgi:predicted nucleic acid-binding protein
LRVPAITICEVYRFVLREGGETLAIQAAGMMSRSLIVDLDATIAMQLATIGNQHQIPLADSIIYATAQSLGAQIWTQDVDLDGLPGVRYFKKK